MKFTDPIVVECNFRMVGRSGGKIVPGTLREGHNVWTVTGRGYLAQLMSNRLYAPPTALRDDKVLWMGLGSGAQPEVASVEALAAPVPYITGTYLKQIQSAVFPTDPPTSVAYNIEFLETEISLGPGSAVILREAGLFSGQKWIGVLPMIDIDPDAGNEPPLAYKNFEPLTKTTQFRLQVRWEIRFR